MPLAIIASTVLLTWVVRHWAGWGLSYGEPVPLLGDLSRPTLGENVGVAFGLFRGWPLVPRLAVLALVAFALFLAQPLQESRVATAALGLNLGGGLANLLDRLGDLSVTDYLDAGLGNRRWPTFNLPDAAIVAGFFLVVWVLLLRDPRDAQEVRARWTRRRAACQFHGPLSTGGRPAPRRLRTKLGGPYPGEDAGRASR